MKVASGSLHMEADTSLDGERGDDTETEEETINTEGCFDEARARRVVQRLLVLADASTQAIQEVEGIGSAAGIEPGCTAEPPSLTSRICGSLEIPARLYIDKDSSIEGELSASSVEPAQKAYRTCFLTPELTSLEQAHLLASSNYSLRQVFDWSTPVPPAYRYGLVSNCRTY